MTFDLNERNNVFYKLINKYYNINNFFDIYLKNISNGKLLNGFSEDMIDYMINKIDITSELFYNLIDMQMFDIIKKLIKRAIVEKSEEFIPLSLLVNIISDYEIDENIQEIIDILLNILIEY